MRVVSWGVALWLAVGLPSTTSPAAGASERTAPTRLSANRLAALRQAVQVAELSRAYRSGAAAATEDPRAEPARFVAASNVTPIVAATTRSEQAPSVVVEPRRDEAVRPAVWVDDRSAPAFSGRHDASNVANPLRATFRAGDPGSTSNPLR